MFTKFRYVAVMALLACPSVYAQGPRGGGGMMGGPGGANLARNKSVQEELKVSSEQATKIDEAADSMRDKYREEMREIREGDESGRREKMEALSHQMMTDAHKSLGEILSPDQLKRFVQIERQQNVLMALHQPAVVSTLKLSDEQVGKVKEIQNDLQKTMRESMRGGQGGGGNRDAREKMMTERKAATEKAVAVLTDEQKSAWKDLVGSPFEVKMEGPRDR